MSVAFWCVLVAGLLPYVATVTAKIGTRFDNHEPRVWLAAQTGYRARAHAAQLNAFEAFPFFAAAVIIAHAAHGLQARVDELAIAFIACRIAYFGAYLANMAALRSVLWLGGLACVVAIFVAAT